MGRGSVAGPRLRDDRRRLIAERAARLIIEGGLSDWNLAARKAARQLGLEQTRSLPGRDEIAAALQAQQALFQRETHPALLRSRRLEALSWMERLARFHPALTGGVAEGWATAHSELRLELTAESSKDVEYALLDASLAYTALGSEAETEHREIVTPGMHGAVHLVIRPSWAHHRLSAKVRLDTAALQALLASR